MENYNISWSCLKTIGNGSCGYHAFAEIFALMALNHPQYLNETLFQPQHPVFQPVQDFWRSIFSLEGAMTRDILVHCLTKKPGNPRVVLENIAPALMILLLSHYQEVKRHHLNPTILAETVLAPGATSFEKELYASKIEMLLSYDQDSHFPALDKLCHFFDFAGRFIAEGALTQELAQSFKKQILLGLPAAFFMDSDMLLTLVTLLFKPSHIENGACYYPCAILSEKQLSEPLNHYQPYAIYQLDHQAHFEYAIQRPASTHNPCLFQANINGAPCSVKPHVISQVGPALSQKKQQQIELARIRAIKHQQYLNKALCSEEPRRPAPPLLCNPIKQDSDSSASNKLNKQLKNLQAQISQLENGRNKACFNMREYQAALQAERSVREELKKLHTKSRLKP